MESKVERIKDILTDYPPTLDLEEWKDKVAVIISSLCQSEPPEQRYDPAIVRIPITSKPEQVACLKPDNCWGCKFADIPNRLCTLLKEVKNEIGIIHTNDVPKWCPVPSTLAKDIENPNEIRTKVRQKINAMLSPSGFSIGSVYNQNPDDESAEYIICDSDGDEIDIDSLTTLMKQYMTVGNDPIPSSEGMLPEDKLAIVFFKQKYPETEWCYMDLATKQEYIGLAKEFLAKAMPLIEAPLRAEIEMLNLALMNRKSEVIRLKDAIIRNQQ